MLQLQENTVLTSLKERWWKQKRGGGKCAESNSGSGQANELGLKHVGGVFVLLLTGLAVALIIGFVEFYYKSSRTVAEERVRHFGLQHDDLQERQSLPKLP